MIAAIHGEVAQPPALQLLVAQCLSWVFMIGLVVTFLLGPLLTILPAHFPQRDALNAANQWIKDRQSIIVVVLFAANVLASQLTQTGAFEVFFDGELVWSKKSSGKLPTTEFLVHQLEVMARQR